jgi:hypothetical protein
MSRLCEKLCMFRYAGDRPADEDLPAGGDIGWQLITPDTIEQYFALEPKWARRFAASLRQGAAGVLVTRGDDWASFGWFSTPGAARPPHIPRWLAQAAFWFYHGHTNAELRQRGFFKILITCLLAEVHRRERSPEILVDVAARNHRSRRAVAEAGFVRAGMLLVRYLWIPKVIRYPLGYSWRRDEPHPEMDDGG